MHDGNRSAGRKRQIAGLETEFGARRVLVSRKHSRFTIGGQSRHRWLSRVT